MADITWADKALGSLVTHTEVNEIKSAVNSKQDELVSNTHIKTVNSTTLVGAGDVAVQATLVSGTNIKTVNSTSLLGSEDITVQAVLAEGAFEDGDKSALDNAQPSLGTVGAAGKYLVEETALGVQGLSIPGTWMVFYTDAAGGIKELSIGTMGHVLVSAGTGGPPIWEVRGNQAAPTEGAFVNGDKTLLDSLGVLKNLVTASGTPTLGGYDFLQDTTKTWTSNQWLGYKAALVTTHGTYEVTITQNGTQGFGFSPVVGSEVSSPTVTIDDLVETGVLTVTGIGDLEGAAGNGVQIILVQGTGVGTSTDTVTWDGGLETLTVFIDSDGLGAVRPIMAGNVETLINNDGIANLLFLAAIGTAGDLVAGTYTLAGGVDGDVADGTYYIFDFQKDALISGTNIKTINSTSLLGSENIVVQAALTEGAFANGDKTLLDSIPAKLDGKENYHGIEAIGAVTFDDANHILSVNSVTFWYQGVKFEYTGVAACDIDETLTLTTNTLYYFSFDEAAGDLEVATGMWNLHTKVPVALVFWNGTTGAIMKEWHSHTRDLDWHINAHLTIGARYYSGLALTTPTTVTPGELSIAGGTLYDEDMAITISNPQTTMRGWYMASAGVYTFADYSLPYVGTTSQPQFLNTTGHTLTNVGATDFVCMWVYGGNDTARPIYIIPTHAEAAHNTVAIARTETPPSLSGLNISPELKLLYKFIFRGNGAFIESVDYRQASSLPAGGTAATSASSVSFAPSGSIVAMDVQAAIEELDTVKILTTTAENSFSVGDVGFLASAGTITLTDANAEATTKGLLYMAMGTVAGGASGTFLREGEITLTSHGFTVGAQLYLSATAGDMTTTAPGAGDFVRHVGYATGTHTVLFKPSDAWVAIT